MTAPTSATMVRATIDVAVSPERAFEVFTSGFDGWWNREHHLLPAALKECGIEPRVGGRVWEESADGDTCTWGRVLTWDPPRSFSFSWLINADFTVPAEDAIGSRVTVTFTPSDAGTHVELVHDQLDVYGDGWERLRDTLEGGWPELLALFAAAT